MKAFFMVSVAEEDRDVLRFTWVDDYKEENPHIIVLILTRIIFGVWLSTYSLNGIIAHHIDDIDSEAEDNDRSF